MIVTVQDIIDFLMIQPKSNEVVLDKNGWPEGCVCPRQAIVQSGLFYANTTHLVINN